MGLIKNTSFYTIGGLLPRLGSFIFLPIYLKYLNPSDYGIVSSLHVLNAVVLVFFTLALPRSLYRIYYDYKANDRKVLLGTVFISVSVIATILIALVFSLQELVQKIYISIDFFPFFAIAFIIIFFQAFSGLPHIVLQIKEKALTYVALNILHFLIRNGFILWYVVFTSEGALGYLKGELVSILIMLPINYFFIRSDIKFKWRGAILKNALLFSIPLIPSLISAWVLNLSNRIFIERYFSTTEVGVFSLGYQIAGLVLIFSLAFKKAYDPYFYKIANNDKYSVARDKLYKTNTIYISLTMITGFLVAFFAKEGVILLFDERYHNAYQIIPIISLAYLISQTTALLNVMIYQEKKTKVVMYITMFGAFINVILNFILVPKFGMYGAAWSTVFSFLIIFLLKYSNAKNYYFIPFNWSRIVPILLVLGSIYFSFYWLDIESIILSISLKLVVTIIVFLLIMHKNRAKILSIIRTK